MIEICSECKESYYCVMHHLDLCIECYTNIYMVKRFRIEISEYSTFEEWLTREVSWLHLLFGVEYSKDRIMRKVIAGML